MLASRELDLRSLNYLEFVLVLLLSFMIDISCLLVLGLVFRYSHFALNALNVDFAHHNRSCAL